MVAMRQLLYANIAYAYDSPMNGCSWFISWERLNGVKRNRGNAAMRRADGALKLRVGSVAMRNHWPSVLRDTLRSVPA